MLHTPKKDDRTEFEKLMDAGESVTKAIWSTQHARDALVNAKLDDTELKSLDDALDDLYKMQETVRELIRTAKHHCLWPEGV